MKFFESKLEVENDEFEEDELISISKKGYVENLLVQHIVLLHEQVCIYLILFKNLYKFICLILKIFLFIKVLDLIHQLDHLILIFLNHLYLNYFQRIIIAFLKN